MRIHSVVSVGIMLMACSGDRLLSVDATPERAISLAAGHEFELTVQTIGPGEYLSPPTISSPSVSFVSVSLVSPAVPAGPTQRFRFRAEAPGQAVITFSHTDQNPNVVDTIDVH